VRGAATDGSRLAGVAELRPKCGAVLVQLQCEYPVAGFFKHFRAQAVAREPTADGLQLTAYGLTRQVQGEDPTTFQILGLRL
jgi:hypothetical protein